MSNKLLYIGSNLVGGISHYFRGEVKEYDTFLWHSIYSISQSGNKERDSFIQQLNHTTANFVVVDLYNLTLNVFVDKQGIYFTNQGNGIQKYFINDKEIATKAITVFANDLLTKFSSDKIILIKTKKASKIVKDDWVVNSGAKEDEFSQLLSHYEDLFKSLTNCSSIDLCGKYFADDMYIFGKSLVNYEKAYYIDAIRKLKKHFEQPKPNVIYNSVSFDLLLERYIKYSDCLYKKFAIGALLNLSNPLENLLSFLSKSFVKTYKKEILGVFLKSTTPELTYENFANIDDLCKNILEWYQCCIKNKKQPSSFDEEIHEYSLKLEKNIIARFSTDAAKYRQYLTTYNYVSYIQTYIYRKRSEKFKNAVLIDVWGSCVSRQIFTELEAIDNVVLKHYLYRNSPLYLFDNPITVDKTLYSNLSLFSNSQWRANIFKYATTREYADIIRYSESEWIIVDLYDLVEQVLTINGEEMICDYDFTTFEIYKVLQEKYSMKSKPFHDVAIDDKFKEKIKKYCEFLKEKYNNKIILINVLFKNMYFTVKGEIKSLNKDYDEMVKKNFHLANVAELVLEYLGDCVYFINTCSKYLPDERFVWGESPVHYEDSYFKDAARIVKHIIEKEPSQKVFTNGPSEETIKERNNRCEQYRTAIDMTRFEQFYL